MRTTILITLLAATAAGAQTPDSTRALSDAQIADAIYTGQQRKASAVLGLAEGGDGFQAAMLRKLPEPGYAIYLQGPWGRVESASADHAKRYLPFTADSVTAAMVAPVLTVRAEPRPKVEDGELRRAADVTHIVLIPHQDGAQPIQPEAVDSLPLEYRNLIGGVVTATGAVAVFDLRKLPAGDFDVVLITTGDEYRWKVSTKDMRAVR